MSSVDGQTFMELIDGKEKILKELLSSIEIGSHNLNSIDKLVGMLSDGKTIKPEQVNLAVTKALRQQLKINRTLTLLAVCYAASDNLSVDAAKCAVKLGQGEEALQAMFRSKFK